jgi:hypothetical protein
MTAKRHYCNNCGLLSAEVRAFGVLLAENRDGKLTKFKAKTMFLCGPCLQAFKERHVCPMLSAHTRPGGEG